MSTHTRAIEENLSSRIPATFVVDQEGAKSGTSSTIPLRASDVTGIVFHVSGRSDGSSSRVCTRWHINFASPFRVNCDDITHRGSLFRSIYWANLIFIGGQFPIYTAVVNVPRDRNCRHPIAKRLGVISGLIRSGLNSLSAVIENLHARIFVRRQSRYSHFYLTCDSLSLLIIHPS